MTLLESMPPTKASDRHVVFVDAVRPQRGPVNFGLARSRERPHGNALTQDEDAFIRWLFERCGLRASAYREETLARRLPACLRLIGGPVVQQARAILEDNPALQRSALDALVIGVTSFFRDAGLFRALGERILPGMIRKDRPLRIWSVGCSDGQELYSVSLLLVEMGWLHRSVLLGTDCRPGAVARASAGVYDDREIHSMPELFRQRYFRHTQAGWRIDPRVRTVVQWRTSDAVQMVEPGAWDIILCRNFVMYLDPNAACDVWKRLQMSLRAGGVLVVGKAERPAIEGFYSLAPSIFRRSSR